MTGTIDAHVHLFHINGADVLYQTADRFGFDRINLLSVPAYAGLTQNIVCAACKQRYPGRTYVFGGLEYESGRSFQDQAERLVAMGFDGFKMIEGKPTIRKKLGLPLDAPVYDGFYSYLAEMGRPLLMHVGDPHTFWDERLIPDWAAEAGYGYAQDQGFVPYEKLYDEVDSLLRRHPRLKLILAHFYFLSWDMERAAAILNQYPNVYFDLTAGIEMYIDFSKNIAAWAGFFEQYAHRLIFGTDSTDSMEKNDFENRNIINETELHFLRNVGTYKAWDLEIQGAVLSPGAQEQILAGNFLRLTGEPRQLAPGAVMEEIEYLISLTERTNDRNNNAELRQLKSFFLDRASGGQL